MVNTFVGFANGLCIENVRLTRNGDDITMSFDMTWENSWNSKFTQNHDGVWVFAKYRLDDGDWKPVYFKRTGHRIVERNLGETNTGFELGLSNAVDFSGQNLSEEVAGIFIYHTKDTSGYTTKFDNTRLVFDRIKHGIIDENVVAIRVFGIEMVYVPKGEFDLGDNSTSHRFVKHDSVLYITNDNTLDWHDTIATPFKSKNSLFPATNAVDNVAGVMVPSVGLVRAINMDGTDSLRGPWAPFGMVARGNNKGDDIYWLTLVGVSNWHWIEFEFSGGGKKRGEYVVIKSRVSETVRPRGFFITASNDGVNYDVISGYRNNSTSGSGIFGVSPNVSGVYVPFRITNPGAYNKYRFHFYSTSIAIPFIGMYDDDLTVNKITNESKLYFKNRQTEIPNEFPKGYESFWVMKYEVTQSAWVDFLNTLTFDQQRNRTGLAPNSAVNTRIGTGRNWIRVRSVEPRSGRANYGLSTDGAAGNWNPAENAGHVAMFNLSWADAAAYADWAGLRPLTELEFEKMSRGFIQSTPNEYVWGSAMMAPISATVTLNNLNKANEVQARPTLTAMGNVRTSPDGSATHSHWPMRVGAFAIPNVSSRLEAGATFYGIMNANDNVAERYVNVSTPQGRAFTGEHGDGRLNGSGSANVFNWPGEDSKGTGYRGFYNNNVVSVSNRQYMDIENAARNMWDGFRGGRTSKK
jgi:hypothetical protein